MNSLRLSIALAASLPAASALAQSPAAPPILGEAPGVEAGRDFAFVGDLDGDDVPDVLVGYPFDDTVGPDVGKAVLLSGADGSLIWEHFGELDGERFGDTVAAAGDVDGDGVPDFMIATPWRRQERGGGWIFSGAGPSLNISYRGLKIGDRFGESIGIIGDFDGDGFSDTLWSAPGKNMAEGLDRGFVYVYTGVDGATIFELRPPADLGGDGLFLGEHVSWVGDVNADGFDDFFSASSATDSTGAVHGAAFVMSGVDGTVLHELVGSDDGLGTITTQGQSIAGAGDVDADGHADFLVSSQVTGGRSRATLYSGADGSVLRVYPEALDGATVARVVNAGDMDGDGILDQAMAGIVADAIVVYSGADGSLLQTIQWAASGVEFGAHFESAGDLDGDGRSDLAVGVPLDDTAGADAGQIALYSGNPCGATENYCVGGLHSAGGTARMGSIGTSSLARNDLILRADGCPSDKFGVFFYGPNAIQAPFGDGFRCVGGLTRRLLPAVSTGPAGSALRPVDVTAPTATAPAILPGALLRFQFWFRDPMGPGGSGFNLSDGLGVLFCD